MPNLNLYMKCLPFMLLSATVMGQVAGGSGDTLVSQVAHWRHPKSSGKNVQRSAELLQGSTRDLSLLDIRAITLDPGGSSPAPVPVSNPNPETDSQLPADALVIIREGNLTVTTRDSSKVLGPGGIALFAGRSTSRFTNTGTAPVNYWVFLFQPRSGASPDSSIATGPPLLIDWKEMTMKKTDKGESRPIFDRSLSLLSRIDMHATTLNPGQVSHPPHVHRTEEIIIMRSGNVEEFIAGSYHRAAAGDLIFLASGVPHAVENKSKERCEYFALQWHP